MADGRIQFLQPARPPVPAASHEIEDSPCRAARERGPRPERSSSDSWPLSFSSCSAPGSSSTRQQIVRSFWPPDPVSTQAKAINDLYTIVFVIAAIIFFVVEGLIVWTVIRYRRRPGDDELPPQTHGHNLAEIVWTVVPTIIVIFLFFVSWQTLNTVEAEAAAA